MWSELAAISSLVPKLPIPNKSSPSWPACGMEGGDGRLRPWAAKWASKINKSATGLPSLKSSTTGSLTRVSTYADNHPIQDHPQARRSKRGMECSWSSTTSSQPSVDVAFTANQYCGYHGYNCYVRHNPKLYWSTWYKEGTTWFSPLSLYSLIRDFLLSQINIWTTTTWSNDWVVLPKPSWYEFLIGFLKWTPALKYLHLTIFFNICDFIHVLIFVTVSKCRKSPKLTNIVISSM